MSEEARDGGEGEGQGKGRHPIGVVSKRSGLSAHTVRAWERRYGAVEPDRSERGIRLFSDAEVERLRILHELTRGGRRIGQIADRPTDELEILLREDRAAEVTAPGSGEDGDEQEESVQELLDEALDAVRHFQAERLDALLRRAALTLSVGTFVDELVGPLLYEIGSAWAEEEIRPAHEHLASAIVIRVTGWLLENFEPAPDAPRIVVGTLPGDRHELGALSVAVTAASEGWRVRYLGPDLPTEDLALAVRRVSAAALAVSMVYSPDPKATADDLRQLRSGLPAELPLLVGGAESETCARTLQGIDAVRLEDFRSLRSVLQGLMAESG